MADGNTSRRSRKDPYKKVCALFWDGSLAWGLMARQALQEAGLPFDLLRSDDIRKGALSRYRMLLVPGGWASNKLNALGGRGQAEIRSFVEAGGNYLGICGGAGMATEDGMGLVPVRRKASTERVASFSGPIRLALGTHSIWRGIQTPLFFAWWPSQFQAGDQRTRVLATYEEAEPDAFSSDIAVAEGRIIGWPDLEKRYGILLDPARLHGEPAVMEGCLGLGRVVLSLVHFDTPGDPNGVTVLQNLWDDLAPGWSSETQSGKASSHRHPLAALPRELVNCLGVIDNAVADLIEWGSKHSLWYWRNPLLLQWRRGVRGLELGTLAVMIGEIGKQLDSRRPHESRPRCERIDLPQLRKGLDEIRDRIVPFVEKARDLLARESLYMGQAALSPLECADPKIRRLRQELFGTAMSHGGRFKQLIDIVDRILFTLIRDEA